MDIRYVYTVYSDGQTDGSCHRHRPIISNLRLYCNTILPARSNPSGIRTSKVSQYCIVHACIHASNNACLVKGAGNACSVNQLLFGQPVSLRLCFDRASYIQLRKFTS